MLKEISIESVQRQEIIDITSEVKKALENSGIKQGIAVIYSPHTTAGITVNENYDDDVKRDIIYALSSFVTEKGYNHAEGNSESHVKAGLIGPSQTIPFEGSELRLGTWQGIFFCEFDGPRKRKTIIKIQGD